MEHFKIFTWYVCMCTCPSSSFCKSLLVNLSEYSVFGLAASCFSHRCAHNSLSIWLKSFSFTYRFREIAEEIEKKETKWFKWEIRIENGRQKNWVKIIQTFHDCWDVGIHSNSHMSWDTQLELLKVDVKFTEHQLNYRTNGITCYSNESNPIKCVRSIFFIELVLFVKLHSFRSENQKYVYPFNIKSTFDCAKFHTFLFWNTNRQNKQWQPLESKE